MDTTEIDAGDGADKRAQSRAIYKGSQPRGCLSTELFAWKIQFFGFDMDYTLAVYKSPQMECMTFGLIVERMISIDVNPDEFASFEYNPIFPVRGLWFDYVYGNLLKVDGFGNILVAVHGFISLLQQKSKSFIQTIACVVDYFDRSTEYQKTSDQTGVKSGEVVMSYKSIFQDIRSAVDWVHFDSDMKKNILGNLEHYVEKDERIVQLLLQLRQSGRKTFLLTNSEYSYTNGVMTYLLGTDWTSFFDITVVDARKPLWFAEGTVFREVNIQTGALKIGIHTGPLRKGIVYAGGSCDSFRRLVKARGKDGCALCWRSHFRRRFEVQKSPRWRTFLVVPELEHELTVWTDRRPLFEKLRELDSLMADIYKNLDGSTKDKPRITNVLDSIRSVTYEMDQEYGVIGSLFRSGSRTTFFASQVERYADLYASSCYNLVHYPTFYFFRSPMTLMPHESTVDHYSTMRNKAEFVHQNSIGQQVRGWNMKMKKSQTFCFEEEDDDTPPLIPTMNEKTPDIIGLNSTDVIVPTPSYVEEEEH
uniref:Cytosolic purine 5'-nucleotidase n=1 Tax=Ditylenchus dipsaci TaxID=166011 RepID=A0A915EJV0_9BILA